MKKLQIIAMRGEDIGPLVTAMQADLNQCLQTFGIESVHQRVVDSFARVSTTGHLAMIFTRHRQLRAPFWLAIRVVGGLHDGLHEVKRYEQTLVSLTPAQQTELEAAKFLLEHGFPSKGPDFFHWTNERRYGGIQNILESLGQEKCQPAIATLKLEHRLDFLRKVNQQCGVSLGLLDPDGNTVEERREEFSLALESHLAMVIALHPPGSELRRRLLAAYEELEARIRQQRKEAREKRAAAKAKAEAEAAKKNGAAKNGSATPEEKEQAPSGETAKTGEENKGEPPGVPAEKESGEAGEEKKTEPAGPPAQAEPRP